MINTFATPPNTIYASNIVISSDSYLFSFTRYSFVSRRVNGFNEITLSTLLCNEPFLSFKILFVTQEELEPHSISMKLFF